MFDPRLNLTPAISRGLRLPERGQLSTVIRVKSFGLLRSCGCHQMVRLCRSEEGRQPTSLHPPCGFAQALSISAAAVSTIFLTNMLFPYQLSRGF